MDLKNTVKILTPLNIEPESFNTEGIYKALSRTGEMATCNPLKAPELIACLSKALQDLNVLVSKIELQYNLCDEYIRRRRSVLVLDELADVVQKKGHASAKSPTGTAEIKEAVIDGDEELGRLRQMQIFLKCLHTLWNGHRKKVEMDILTVRKIMDRTYYDKDLSVPAPQDPHTVVLNEDPDF